MKIILVFAAFLTVALAKHDDEQKMPNMPNMANLPNMPNLNMAGGLPQLPAGMKLDDLKDAFHNMPPSMKDRLNSMAQSFGLQMDDVEEALNNPPPQLQAYFENNDQAPKNGGSFEVPTQAQPQQQQQQAGPGQMPDLASMMGGMDIGSMMKNMNLDGLLGNTDVNSLLQNVDINSIMKNVDVGSIMKNMDIGSLLQGGGDIGSIMQNMDIGNIMKNVDVGSIMKNMDVGSLMQGGGLGSIMKNMDVGSMMKNLDIGSMMKDFDLASLMQNVDMEDVSKMVGVPMPDIKTIMNMLGLPEDSEPSQLVTLLGEKMREMGLPTDDPAKMMEYAKNKLKNFKMSDIDMNSILNILEGQLEAMGMPTDNPEKMQEIFKDGMKDLGLEGLSDLDLKNPKKMATQLKEKAFTALGIDENEDPEVIKQRVEDQLFEEARKMGSNLHKGSSPEDAKKELMGVLSQHLKDIGLDFGSGAPEHMKDAITKQLASMGLPMFDIDNMKGHVVDMLMKQLMGKAMHGLLPMIMNIFMPKRHQPEPEPMPPMGPPMMPPMMMHPPMMPLDLEVNVNIEQPEKEMPMPPPYMPRYLVGAEQTLDSDLESFESDEHVYHHIMMVRQALRQGEMPEDALQELIEDLMEARLKNRMLMVKNMFLRDRLAGMQEDMQDMFEPEDIPQIPERPLRASPIMRALTGRM